MLECPKFAGTEINQHSGKTLATQCTCTTQFSEPKIASHNTNSLNQKFLENNVYGDCITIHHHNDNWTTKPCTIICPLAAGDLHQICILSNVIQHFLLSFISDFFKIQNLDHYSILKLTHLHTSHTVLYAEHHIDV